MNTDDIIKVRAALADNMQAAIGIHPYDPDRNAIAREALAAFERLIAEPPRIGPIMSERAHIASQIAAGVYPVMVSQNQRNLAFSVADESVELSDALIERLKKP